ncbi:MAG: HNH endonuclease [Alphaproteobacteria bacterium]|nr:HNH endonuclease [Alphaproteobacteria bacterium]
MNDKAAVIVDVCAALSSNQTGEAASILLERYPFAPFSKVARRYSVQQMVATFLRDGFIDRYSGARLVCGAALRLISKRLPDHFPFQNNWRTDACHFAFWDLAPTIDHILPVSRGGTDDESNWATTSMLRNSAKANSTLDELGWSLYPAGDVRDWDGLLGWFIDEANADRAVLADPYLRRWFTASRSGVRPKASPASNGSHIARAV